LDNSALLRLYYGPEACPQEALIPPRRPLPIAYSVRSSISSTLSKSAAFDHS